MDRDDNRARGDRSLSEPGGSSFGNVQLSDAPRVCEVKAVGTGVEFRHRIGGTAATDERPHELREQGQMTWIEQGMDGGARKRSLRDSRRMGSKNADGPGDQGPGEMEEARDRSLSWGISSSVAATPTAGNSWAGNSSDGLP